MIEQGTLGAVKHFESHFDRFRPEVRVRWREQNVPGSGLWFDLGAAPYRPVRCSYLVCRSRCKVT